MRYDLILSKLLHIIFSSSFSTHNNAIPVLMYHSIESFPSSKKNSFYSISTNPTVFESHLKFLKLHNYQSTSFSKLDDAWIDKTKKVIITFDDAYFNFYEFAFPLLLKYGFSATVFLPTDYIYNTYRRKFNNRHCLNWGDIDELSKLGIEFGSHSCSHPILYGKPLQKIKKEIKQSKEIIESHIAKEAVCFSYPYAFPEHDTTFINYYVDILKSCKYKYAVTTIIGLMHQNDHPYLIRRLHINSSDNPDIFNIKISGFYNWIHLFQFLFKRLKSYPNKFFY